MEWWELVGVVILLVPLALSLIAFVLSMIRAAFEGEH